MSGDVNAAGKSHDESTAAIRRESTGPAEEWFCRCLAWNLRPASCAYCPRCRESAPWAYVDPSNYRTWPRGD